MRVNRSLVETRVYSSFKQFTGKILEILQEGQEEGVVRKDVNLYVLRQLILGVLEHGVTRWLIKGQKYDLMEHYEDISKLVISAVSCPREIQERNKSSLSLATSLKPAEGNGF
jgi:TetR/AcrR family fatty acid metabolism transcriptional regulator